MKIPNHKNVILQSNKNRDEFHTRRAQAVGASEVPSLMGLSTFTNIIETFWNKVKLTKPTPHNISSISGEIMEPIISGQYFVYYDPSKPDDKTLIQNMESKNKLRTVQRFNRGVKMRDHFLSCTLDYVVKPDRWAAGGAILECKNFLSHVISRYEEKVMPSTIVQIQAQLAITKFPLAYLAQFVDGRFFQCYEITPNEEIQNIILNKVDDFWARVEKARIIWNDPMLSQDEKLLQIYPLEPEIDPSAQDTLSAFMNVRFKEESKKGKIMVTAQIQEEIDKYKDNRSIETEAGNKKDMYGNSLKSTLLAHSCDEITNPDGKVIASWRESAKGTPILRVN